jgi:hypothetical protein
MQMSKKKEKAIKSASLPALLHICLHLFAEFFSYFVRLVFSSNLVISYFTMLLSFILKQRYL